MWPINYTPGSKPGVKRKAAIPEKTSKKNSKYEETRVREFKPEWQKGRDWLKYSEVIGMTCSACIEVGRTRPFHTSTFTSGSKNYRFSTVSDHETSSVHVKSVEIIKSRKAAENRESVAHKSVISLNNSVRKQIEYKFRNIHALIKYNRPISDFVWLNKLDEAKGLYHGNTYNNQKAATTFLENISGCEKEKLEKMMGDVKFFSISMDGSTDISTVEQETLFIRFSVNGRITTRFLCIGEPESTCSLDLFKFVQKMMAENGLDNHVQKLIGLGSDGASNMTGAKNGLVAKLKEVHPELIGVHCIAHRLELAFRDVFKKDKMYSQLSTLLLGLFYFYKNSSKQRKCLRECIKVLGINGTLPHKINSTRWLPHMKRALENLFRTFPAFLSQLQNASHVNPKAEGLAKMLCNLQILAFASILEDIVKPLARLSLMLQRKDLTLADARDAIFATKEVLNLYDASTSLRTKQILETKQFFEYSLKGNGKFDMQKKATEIVDGLIKQMDLRYKDTNEDLLRSTLIASFRNWPTLNEPEFGVHEISTLSKFFKCTLDQASSKSSNSNDLLEEWQTLKCLVYKRFSGKLLDVSWEDVFKSFTECGLSNVFNVIDLILSLPPTSVVNETAFNQMKLLKTERRHRLSNQHLNDCMLTRLESAEITEFDPQPAIDRWMLTGNRRPSYKRSFNAKGQLQTVNVTEIDNTELNVIGDEPVSQLETESEKLNESESERQSEE